MSHNDSEQSLLQQWRVYSTEATYAKLNGDKTKSISTLDGADTPNNRSFVPSEIRASEDDGSYYKEPSQNQPTIWRPFWLRRFTLLVFGGLFFITTIALLPLLVYSHRNEGFTVAHKNLSYLWRFGPTALLTITSVMWARVEMQAMRCMPWALMCKTPSRDICRLDYTAMIPPIALFQALKRGHYFVFLIVSVAILLKIQIVLSAGLFYSHDIGVINDIDIEIESSFDVSTNLSTKVSSASYLNALGMKHFSLQYPFGVDSECAYQTFRSSEANPSPRGTSDKPISVVVDGLFMDMKCVPMTNYTVQVRHFPSDTNSKYVNDQYYNTSVSMDFQGCGEPLEFDSNIVVYNRTMNKTNQIFLHGEVWILQYMPKGCSSLPQQFPPFVYLTQVWNLTSEDIPYLNKTVGVLCSSTAELSKVTVEDNGSSPVVRKLEGSSSTPVVSNPWTMLTYSVVEDGGSWAISDSIDNSLHGPIPAYKAFKGYRIYETRQGDQSETSLDLLWAVTNLTTAINPFLAHYHLRQNASEQGKGTRQSSAARLQVNLPVCVSMIIILVILGIVAAWASFQSSQFMQWRRNPTTLLGSSMLLLGSGKDYSPEIDYNQEKKVWTQPQNAALPLQSWLRIAFVVYALGLVIGLSITLNISQTSDGLITVNDRTHSLWWTSVPALAILPVALYASSSDTAIRNLITLCRLGHRSCSLSELDESLSDILGVRALYRSIQLKEYSITVSQTLAILCGFLTTISATLFALESIPQIRNVSIERQTWFGPSNEPEDIMVTAPPDKNGMSSGEEENPGDGKEVLGSRKTTRQILSSLVLTSALSNITWPPNTYDDLIFPNLKLGENPDLEDSGHTSILVETSAAQINADCTRLNVKGEDMDITKSNLSSSDTEDDTYTWNQKVVCPDGCLKLSGGDGTGADSLSTGSKDDSETIYFASTLDADLSSEKNPAKSYALFHLWGSFPADTLKPNHVSAWSCTYSWTEVPVVFTTSDTGQDIIDNTQPVEVKADVRQPVSTNLTTNVNDLDAIIYMNNLNISSISAGIYKDMSSVLQPFGRFQVEDLANPDNDDAILQDLTHTFGVASAQLANLINRHGRNETDAEQGNMTPAQVTLLNSRRKRLVQNPTSTAVILVVLSLTIVVNIWGLVSGRLRSTMGRRSWLLDLELKDVAPENCNSIAAIGGLFYASNMYDEVQRASHESYRGSFFRMGWFSKGTAIEKVLTIGMMGDAGFVYKGNKKDVSKEKYSTIK